MKLNKRCGTHIPVLLQLLEKTDGPVLELGVGLYSTHFLHSYCNVKDRQLVSYESILGWYNRFKRYNWKKHELFYVENWDDADIERYWDVVLVDSTPGGERKELIKRLANYAKYIIIHDAEENHEHEYEYKSIYPLFKYKKLYDIEYPNTMIVSNFIDVTKLDLK